MTKHGYQQTDHGHTKSWLRIHGTAEETHVVILESDGDYVGFAIDIDPRSWEAVASAHLCYEPTHESAVKKSQAWMQDNPKGVLGGQDQQSGGFASRFFRAIVNALKKLDQSTTEDLQQTNEENQ